MKTFLIVTLALFLSSAASYAGTYLCTNQSEGNTFTITIAKDLKSVAVSMEGYSETPETGTWNTKYQARNVKWKDARSYDFGEGPFGEDGSTSFLISKELLADAATGFAQYRNTWDTYTSVTLFCKKQ